MWAAIPKTPSLVPQSATLHGASAEPSLGSSRWARTMSFCACVFYNLRQWGSRAASFCSPLWSGSPFTRVRVGEASHPGPAPKGLEALNFLGPGLLDAIKAAVQQLVTQAIHQSGPGAQLPQTASTKAKKRMRAKLRKAAKNRVPAGGSIGKPASQLQPAPKGDDKGVGPKDKGKGKGKGHQPRPNPKPGPAAQDAAAGWTTVARKPRIQEDFTLRPQDWTAPIFKASELAAKFDTLPDGDTLRGVVLAQSDDEFASISSLLRGSPMPHQVLLLRRSREAKAQRVPGQAGDRLTFRNFEAINVCSSNASGSAPQFKGSDGTPIKVKVTESAVLYLRISKLYCEPKLWAAFERAPAKEALQWTAGRHVQALDSFSWTREKGKATDSEQFFGLVRVAKDDVGPLLSSSGQQGVFASAPRSLSQSVAAPCEVVWVDRATHEKPTAYLERVTRMSSAHGLACHNLRLGWRRPLAKDEVPIRVWTVTDVPKAWDHRAVSELLSTAFAEPAILSHRWTKRSLTYRFKAKVKSGGDRDLVPLVCEHLGANITLWASLAPPRQQQTLVKPLFTRSVPVVKAAEAPPLQTEALAIPTAITQDTTGKDQSQSKQAKQEVRKFPAELQLSDCPRDGNCVLHAFSKALKHFRAEERHPRILRAELVTHLLKHERYSREWDRLDPKGKPCADFPACCKLIECDGTYLGELEVAALSHICHFKTVVIPQGLDFQPAAYNTREKMLIVLWFTPGHVDLALPKDEGTKYPEHYAKITQGPIGAFRAGVGCCLCCVVVCHPTSQAGCLNCLRVVPQQTNERPPRL